MKRLIIVGSPRSNGRSAHLAEMIFETNIDERPEDELFLVPVSEIDVGPCIGCNACREKAQLILEDEGGAEVRVAKHRCVFDDDMQTLYDLIDDADEITVVSPVYFSGAPGSLKCLLDRLQPYFWAGVTRADSDEVPAKRPAALHVVGEGGDPHGHQALVSEVKSALAVAGFRLERVLDWVGKIGEDGEIIEEAAQTLIGASQDAGERGGQASRAAESRPKLDLSSGLRDAEGPADPPGKSAARSKSAGPSRGKDKNSAHGTAADAGRGASSPRSARKSPNSSNGAGKNPRRAASPDRGAGADPDRIASKDSSRSVSARGAQSATGAKSAPRRKVAGAGVRPSGPGGGLRGASGSRSVQRASDFGDGVDRSFAHGSGPDRGTGGGASRNAGKNSRRDASPGRGKGAGSVHGSGVGKRPARGKDAGSGFGRGSGAGSARGKGAGPGSGRGSGAGKGFGRDKGWGRGQSRQRGARRG